jgi:hypothetical protein
MTQLYDALYTAKFTRLVAATEEPPAATMAG